MAVTSRALPALVLLSYGLVACSSLQGLTGGAPDGGATSDATHLADGARDAGHDAHLGRDSSEDATHMVDAHGLDAHFDVRVPADVTPPPPRDAGCTADGGIEAIANDVDSFDYGIALDSQAIYYAGATGVRRVLKDGSGDTLLATSSLQAVATDGVSVYWGGLNGLASGVFSVSATGGGGAAVKTLASISEDDPLHIALGGGWVYWVASVPEDGALPYELLKVATTGGTPQTLLADQAMSVVTDGTSVYWSNSQNQVYAQAFAGGAIRLVGGMQNGNSTGPIDVDATNVYISDDVGLYSIPKTGGAATELANTFVSQLAHDSTNLYWVDAVTDTIYKMPTGGGVPVTLVYSSSVTGGGMAVDSECVYWVALGNGAAPVQLYKAPK
jgi:hypothetical protein